MIQAEIPGSRFLDLFSGSGGIAIEALSRGASEAVMVDNDREAVRCMKQNIAHTHFQDVSRVMAMDVLQALRRLEQLHQPFDIIFMDPPYRMDYEKRILPFLLQSSLAGDDTLIIIEAASDTETDWMEKQGCIIERIKEYKSNCHIFLRRQ